MEVVRRSSGKAMSGMRREPDLARKGGEGRVMTQLGHSTYLRFHTKGDVRRVGGTATARPFTPQNGSERDTRLGGPIESDNWLVGCCLQLKVVEVERLMLG